MTEQERILTARLAAAEATIAALRRRVESLEARNRPLGPKPGCWPGTVRKLNLKPVIEPDEPLRFTSKQ